MAPGRTETHTKTTVDGGRRDGYWIGKGNPIEVIHVDWMIRSRTLTLLQPHSWHANTLMFRTPVSTETFITRVGKTSATAEQVVRSTLGEGELLAYLTVAIVFVSGETGRPVAVPHRERLNELLAAARGKRASATFDLGRKLGSRFPSIFALREFPAAPAATFKTTLVPRTSDVDMYGHVNNAIFCLYLHDARVEAAIAQHGGSVDKAAEKAIAAAAEHGDGAVSGSGVAAASAAESPLAGLSLSLEPIVSMSFDYSAPLFPGRTYSVALWEERKTKLGLFIVADAEGIAFRAKFRCC